MGHEWTKGIAGDSIRLSEYPIYPQTVRFFFVPLQLGAHLSTCLVLSVCHGVRGQDVAAAFDIVLHKGVTGQSLQGLR